MNGLVVLAGTVAYFAAAIAWIHRGDRRDRVRLARLFSPTVSRAPAGSVSPAPPGARRCTPVDTVAPRSAVSTGPSIPRCRADATLPFTSGASPARAWAGSEDTPAHLTAGPASSPPGPAVGTRHG